MKLGLYKRDENGEITYHGLREADSAKAMMKMIYFKKPMPAQELQVLPKGWPDRAVTWFGRWGAGGNMSKLKLRQVNLTDEQVEVAKSIGDGNISEGIRIALSAFG
jgi:hypothetical protein